MADQDILIGPGRLYRAALSTANPDESTITFGEAWGGTWVDMGDLIEGSPVTLGMPEEFTKVYTEQSTSAKNAVRTRREPVIKCSLAEHSIANMAVLLQGTAETTAAAGGGQVGYSEIPFGDQAEINFYKWGIEAFRKDSADNVHPVRWFLHKGYVRMSGDTTYAKRTPTGIPIEITVLGDGSQTAGEELGILQIVTAVATAT